MAIKHKLTLPRASLWGVDHEGDLDDLDDVDATSPNNDDALVFDSATGKWEASAATGGEVLMVTGITNPPDPMLNTDGDDWVYSS